jgi:hypothetical protein
MAYTPPAGTAVDFTLTGDAYTPPAGTAVDFSWDTGINALMVFPFVLAASANHQAAFTDGGVLPFVLTASANHQVASAAGQFIPIVVGDARQQIASVATTFPFSISAVAQSFPIGTQLATVAGTFKCAVEGRAHMVYAPEVSQVFPFMGSALAALVYSPTAVIIPQMGGGALAFRPGYEASAKIGFPMGGSALANPGRVASAEMVFPMRGEARTFRMFRASAHIKFIPIIEGIAA